MKYIGILTFLLFCSERSHADVRNGLGTCFFNTSNKLIQEELNLELKFSIEGFVEESMLRISQSCIDENRGLREMCQINFLLEAFDSLKEKHPVVQRVIDENISEDGACLYLTLFK